MKFRKALTTAAATVAVALTATAVPGPAQAARGEAEGEQSLATVLAADGNRFDRNGRDFDILERAVLTVLGAKPDSPVGLLADGSVALTAFVPTDNAFRRLVTDLTGRSPHREKTNFRVIARNLDVDTIEAVLLYHVVPGATITYRQAKQADGARLDTALEDAQIGVSVRRHKSVVRIVDADTDDLNARVIRSAKNINKGNLQIAHGITRVLRPVDLP